MEKTLPFHIPLTYVRFRTILAKSDFVLFRPQWPEQSQGKGMEQVMEVLDRGQALPGYLAEEMRSINYLLSEIDAAYHEASQRLGLADSAMQILYILCSQGGACLLRDICRQSGTSKQTINSALRKLEAEGLVYGESFDGKQRRVCLTEQGRHRAERTVARLMAVEKSVLNTWSKQELSLYLSLTQRYLTSFKERIKELSAEE